ncbi:hypothetical protein D9M71_445070 [compost metagenome]
MPWLMFSMAPCSSARLNCSTSEASSAIFTTSSTCISRPSMAAFTTARAEEAPSTPASRRSVWAIHSMVAFWLGLKLLPCW